ncbi:MAG: helix-turn-helix domain-containing protein [Bifidobacterium mongoliense]|uniref:Rep2 n=1 Tax=Propionibacterium freudenreichii TaxID=1744 RepID=Q9F6K0_9ACTN|nr:MULTISPECIES: helix-turn-helix domain-containing protein [Actinomycetes]AAG25295.1 rep2 [Propionibacterium freudenreichii]MDN6554499.1 helix-turn-helix domain-containing protein [Bifidobacterium mongoliense]MDN6783636.1 helix-turn-helix domain-containing protein [Bifidobacterium mongoliense]
MTTRERLPRNGYSIAAAAKKLGVSESTVKRWTSEPREEFVARVAARHARIRELRSEGQSMRAIAAEVGVSVGTVHYALNKNRTDA